MSCEAGSWLQHTVSLGFCRLPNLLQHGETVPAALR